MIGVGIGGEEVGGLWGFRFVYVNQYVYEFLNEYEGKGFGYDAVA